MLEVRRFLRVQLQSNWEIFFSSSLHTENVFPRGPAGIDGLFARVASGSPENGQRDSGPFAVVLPDPPADDTARVDLDVVAHNDVRQHLLPEPCPVIVRDCHRNDARVDEFEEIFRDEMFLRVTDVYQRLAGAVKARI